MKLSDQARVDQAQTDIEDFTSDASPISRGKPVTERLPGREYPDPRPVSAPLQLNRQVDMMQHVRNLVRSEMLRQTAQDAGFETMEEADDFDVDDDFDPSSPYEEQFEPEAPLIEVTPETSATPPAEQTEAAPAASPAPKADPEPA